MWGNFRITPQNRFRINWVIIWDTTVCFSSGQAQRGTAQQSNFREPFDNCASPELISIRRHTEVAREIAALLETALRLQTQNLISLEEDLFLEPGYAGDGIGCSKVSCLKRVASAPHSTIRLMSIAARICVTLLLQKYALLPVGRNMYTQRTQTLRRFKISIRDYKFQARMEFSSEPHSKALYSGEFSKSRLEFSSANDFFN